MVFSSKRTHVFLKVRCPIERLKQEADRCARIVFFLCSHMDMVGMVDGG
jgi:hypothetical protein